MAYQRDSFLMARRLGPAALHDDFLTRFAEAARITRQAVSVMSSEDSQLLSDVARGRGLVRLCQLCGISERALREGDALAFSEALRGHVMFRRTVRHTGVVAFLAALEEETASNGPADETALAFLKSPSSATRDRAIETHLRQEVATRTVIDALHTTDLSKSRVLLTA
jgi:hypothetical protein